MSSNFSGVKPGRLSGRISLKARAGINTAESTVVVERHRATETKASDKLAGGSPQEVHIPCHHKH